MDFFHFADDAEDDEEMIASIEAQASSTIPSISNMEIEGDEIQNPVSQQTTSRRKDQNVVEDIGNDMGKMILLILFNQL